MRVTLAADADAESAGDRKKAKRARKEDSEEPPALPARRTLGIRVHISQVADTNTSPDELARMFKVNSSHSRCWATVD